MRLLRINQVIERTALSRSSIYRLERTGFFPRRRQLNPGAGDRSAVAWVEDEVVEWCASRSPVGVEADESTEAA
jgi:prophage regulatory protein